MNWSAAPVAEVSFAVVTVTSTVPLPAGLVAVIWVSLLNVKLATVEPNETPVASVKPEPVMVTLVPPAADPLVGLMLVTDGTTVSITATI